MAITVAKVMTEQVINLHLHPISLPNRLTDARAFLQGHHCRVEHRDRLQPPQPQAVLILRTIEHCTL